MKNTKITRKITQGMYVLSTDGGGCIVDAVSQISAGDHPLIAVAVMKKNYTNELLHKNDKFSLCPLQVGVDANIIKTFGFLSMRDVNKFERVDYFMLDDIPIIKNSLGYMVCVIIEKIENDTHTLFIGKMIHADVFRDEDPMSYQYYQNHKDSLLKVEMPDQKTAYVCPVCGYVYYGDSLPDDYRCPICGVLGSEFKKQE